MWSIQFCPLETITLAKLFDAILSSPLGTTLLTSPEVLVNLYYHSLSNIHDLLDLL